jgi:protein-S-isoprenylcysteine O-methyltransferase Ste14
VVAIRAGVGIVWVVFWLYWLISARDVKSGTGGGSGWAVRSVVLLSVLAVNGLARVRSAAVTDLAVGLVGALVVLCGLGLAVWARLHLGRNWGMPMSRKDSPELVTSGPYRYVRHPIYTGLLLALLGSALATNLWVFVPVLVLGWFFYRAATVEERNLVATFPTAYPQYQARTRKIIPFVL